MPRSASKEALLLPDLLRDAQDFVAPARCAALSSKWVEKVDRRAKSADEITAMYYDTAMLAVDLVVSQPSPSGSTAFDRLGKTRAKASLAPETTAAIAALRQSRFRLLRLEGICEDEALSLVDAISGETFWLVDPEIPALATGTRLFGRLVALPGGEGCMPGAITPMDADAADLAQGHPAAGAAGSAGLRWAEAVYCHVVRNGTLDVPGLNRPSDELYDEDDVMVDDVLAAAIVWSSIGDAAPMLELVDATRMLATRPQILRALAACVEARELGHPDVAVGYERVLLVQLETLLRRERSGSASFTLEGVVQEVARLATDGRLKPAARDLLTLLRQRLGAVPRAPDAPDLDRLIQRIQALRAKTVAQGCTEQEALAAAEKVAELLDRYGLSLSELDYRAQPCEGIGIETTRRRMGPIDDCVPAIAAYFECRVWLEHSKGAALRYVFFGLRGDVAAAQYLYEMVERAFETETDAFRAGPIYADMAGERRSATNSFQIGLARGIASKLQAMRATRDTTSRSASGRDLVPVKAAMVDEELAKLGLAMEQREVGKSRRVLTDAFDAGQEAGERFEVAPALTRAA